MRLYYLANMIDSVTVSERHNSDYSQKCLDYIPGSAISGALASVLYRAHDIDKKSLNTIFQSNSSVFSNCLPLKRNEDNGTYEFVLPAISCLYFEKGTEEGESPFVNRVISRENGSKQLKQVRSGYMSADARKYTVTKDSVTKTAIDCRTLTAAESQLFSLSFINKVEAFWGWVDIPDSVSCPDVIKNFFNTEIRVGKSRSSEFGRVRLQLLDSTVSEKIRRWQEHVDNKNDSLYLWCVSDIEFIDLKSGMPTVIPQASNFWLKDFVSTDWEYDADRSFIRTGSVRFFNRKRNGLDGEKQFIKKGSLICFKRKGGRVFSDDELKEISLHGIGLSRHQGFGTVLVNPEWIDSKQEIKAGTELSLFNKIVIDEPQFGTATDIEDDYDYLTSYVKACITRDDNDYEYQAHDILKSIRKIYNQARLFNDKLDIDQYGRETDQVVNWGPNNSQWGVLLEIIKNVKGADDKPLSDGANSAVMNEIRKKLDSEKKRESSKTTWDVHFATDESSNATFAEEFMKIIDCHKLGAIKHVFDTLLHYNLSDFNKEDWD